MLYPTKPTKILPNLLNSFKKRLLRDKFNMAAVKNSLLKCRSPQNCQAYYDNNFTGEFFICCD